MRVVGTWMAIACWLAGCDAEPQAARTYTLATWCWDEECVRDGEIRAAALSFAKAHAIDSMYLQLTSDYEEPELFQDFASMARSAHDQGMSLRWVDGRAEWASPAQHAQAVAALDIAVRINQRLKAVGRTGVTAIVYDVEPWALPEWEDEAGALITGYTAMVERLHEAAALAGLELWIALPFWFEEEAASAAPELAPVLAHADGILLMAYRDDAEEIERVARPTVEHAAELHVPVIIGLETKCVSPGFISFCDAGERALETALSELRDRFEHDRGVLGFAVHELSTWQALDGS